MRPELNQYNHIDNYIAGKLSEADKLAFEAELAKSPELQEQLEFQTMVAQSISRSALRAEINAIVPSASGAVGFSKWTWGIAIVAAASAIAIALYFTASDDSTQEARVETVEEQPKAQPEKQNTASTFEDNDSTSTTNQNTSSTTPLVSSLAIPYVPPVIPPEDSIEVMPPSTHTGTSHSSTLEAKVTPWVDFDVQEMVVSAEEGGAIRGKQGTLIIVPSNAFLDSDGNTIEGEVDINLIEALNWEDMFAYNLTTVSNGHQLSSGGMLNIVAKQYGKKLQINPAKPLYFEVPTSNFDPNMHVFEGDLSNGEINWKNPKQTERYLTRVELDLLDFFPPGFEYELSLKLPYKGMHKMTAELSNDAYYSLSEWYTPAAVSSVPSEIPTFDPNLSTNMFPSSHTKSRKLKNSSFSCMINPESIKALKSERFKNTFVATKEFEQRLAVMHQMQFGQSYLDIYIKNLDKDLKYSDSLCAIVAQSEPSKAEFRKFYGEGATTIKNSIYSDDLFKYYEADRKKLKGFKERRLADPRRVEFTGYSHMTNSVITSKHYGDMNRSAGNVTSGKSYTFTWSGNDWISVNSYLNKAGEKVHDLHVKTESKKLYGAIYQTYGGLNTAVSLDYSKGGTWLNFPSESESTSIAVTIGIQSLTGQYIAVAIERYNPYDSEELTLNWDTIHKSQLVDVLRAASPDVDVMNFHNQANIDHIERFINERKKREIYIAKRETVRRTRKDRESTQLHLLQFSDNCTEVKDFIIEEEPTARAPLITSGTPASSSGD